MRKVRFFVAALCAAAMILGLAGSALAAQAETPDLETVYKMAQKALDQQAIQNVMSRHVMYHCYGLHQEEMEQLWVNEPENRATASFGQNQGYMVGYAAIWEAYVDGHTESWLESARKYCANNDIDIEGWSDEEILDVYGGIGQLLLHVTTTSVIEVAEDGQTAKCFWYSPGLVAETGQSGNTIWEAYGVDFVKEGNDWKIWHLHMYTDFTGSFYIDLGKSGASGGGQGGGQSAEPAPGGQGAGQAPPDGGSDGGASPDGESPAGESPDGESADVPAPGEGAAPADAPAPGEGAAPADAPAPGEGAAPADAPAPGEGAAPADAPAPGEGAAPADAPAPGEGAAPVDASAPGEGVAPTDAPAPGEGAAPTDAPAPGEGSDPANAPGGFATAPAEAVSANAPVDDAAAQTQDQAVTGNEQTGWIPEGGEAIAIQKVNDYLSEPTYTIFSSKRLLSEMMIYIPTPYESWSFDDPNYGLSVEQYAKYDIDLDAWYAAHAQ